MAVQPFPGSPFEVVEAELFLELLMGLLADPPRFDGAGQLLDRRVSRHVGEVVLALAAVRCSPTSQISSPGRELITPGPAFLCLFGLPIDRLNQFRRTNCYPTLMKRLVKILLGAVIAVGVLIIVASIWAGQQLATTPLQAAPPPAETKSAYAKIQEACAREVGQHGPDAVQRCEVEILGGQIEANMNTQKAIEDDAIARARENMQ